MTWELPTAELTVIFEKLGVEGVQRGLQGIRGGGWNQCFLARVYGEPGALCTIINVNIRDGVSSSSGIVAPLLGLTVPETKTVVRAFDGYNEPFRACAKKWLRERIAQNAAIEAVIASPEPELVEA